MNRDLATLLGVLAFAIVTALLYFSSMGAEAPPAVAEPTPARTPVPRAVAARSTPLPARPRPVSTPRPTPPPAPAATPEEEEETERPPTTIRGHVVLSDGSQAGVCDVFVTVDGKRSRAKTDESGAFRVERPGEIGRAHV